MNSRLAQVGIGGGVAAMVILLTACGSVSPAAQGAGRSPGSPVTPSPPPAQIQAAATGQQRSVDACKLLTPAEVRQVTGQAFGPFKPSMPGMKNICIAINPSGAEVNVAVHPGSAAGFALEEPSGSHDVAGLGDQAYCTSFGALSVLTGERLLMVTSSTCAQAEALARLALPRL